MWNIDKNAVSDNMPMLDDLMWKYASRTSINDVKQEMNLSIKNPPYNHNLPATLLMLNLVDSTWAAPAPTVHWYSPVSFELLKLLTVNLLIYVFMRHRSNTSSILTRFS